MGGDPSHRRSPCLLPSPLSIPACPGRELGAPGAGGGPLPAGGRLPGAGPVPVLGGGGPRQGAAHPDGEVLGGAEGERAAAPGPAGGELLPPAEVQRQPGGGNIQGGEEEDTGVGGFLNHCSTIISSKVLRIRGGGRFLAISIDSSKCNWGLYLFFLFLFVFICLITLM